MKVVIASDNQDKVKELKALLADYPIEIAPQSEFNVKSPEETGLSFIENAILKARHASKETELPAIADDSGLCVDALAGAPGIYSARYAGPEYDAKKNIKKLLKAIHSLKGEDRSASFYCAIAYVRRATDPTPLIAVGQWFGRMLEASQGDKGFGYDPIFYIPHLNCSAAELSADQKNQLSHRAKALKEFLEKFQVLYGSHTKPA